MNNASFKVLSSAILLLAATFFPSNADLIVQDQCDNGEYLSWYQVSGQSFMADENTLTGIDLALWDQTPQYPLAIRIDLFEGDGFNGRLIGSSGTRGITTGYNYWRDGWFSTNFDNVMLNVGSQYTFAVSTISGSGAIYLSTSNPYNFGRMYSSVNGSLRSGYENRDLTFRAHTTTILPVAVPEPASFSLLLTGMFLFGSFRFFRKKVE
jgi:hypothetical protein